MSDILVPLTDEQVDWLQRHMNALQRQAEPKLALFYASIGDRARKAIMDDTEQLLRDAIERDRARGGRP